MVYIYANIGDILMVNVIIYTIHGSYGFCWRYLEVRGLAGGSDEHLHRPVGRALQRSGEEESDLQSLFGCGDVATFVHVTGLHLGWL